MDYLNLMIYILNKMLKLLADTFLIFSRAEIRAKNLFNVADCRMHWQKSGDHLCVKVDRYTKLIKKDRHDAKYSVSFYFLLRLNWRFNRIFFIGNVLQL